MSKTEPERCTCHCGHTHIVSRRKIVLNRDMVTALSLVFNYLWERQRSEFSRMEVKKLFNESQSARFGDLVYFGGLVYKKQKGEWGMNFGRTKSFLDNKTKLHEWVAKDPITKNIVEQSEEMVGIREVKGVTCLLSSNGQFMVEYLEDAKSGTIPLL